MRMLCIAAEADPTGYVTVNGRPLGVTDIARLAGVTETECESLLAELDRNGVFSRDRKGVIYSRRMVRDANMARKNQKNGQKGGNPSLQKQKGISDWDNPPDKGGVKAQRPETRYQKPEEREIPKILAPRELVDEPLHRSLIADLRKRGHNVLTDFEKTFLGSVYGLKTLTRKQRETFDAIRLKVDELVKVANTSEWEPRLKWARKHRQWGNIAWGPMPGQPGCKVPAHLLQPADGDGWTEWKAAS